MTLPFSLFIPPPKNPDLLCSPLMHLDSLVISTSDYIYVSQLKPASLPNLPACTRPPDLSSVARPSGKLRVCRACANPARFK